MAVLSGLPILPDDFMSNAERHYDHGTTVPHVARPCPDGLYRQGSLSWSHVWTLVVLPTMEPESTTTMGIRGTPQGPNSRGGLPSTTYDYPFRVAFPIANGSENYDDHVLPVVSLPPAALSCHVGTDCHPKTRPPPTWQSIRITSGTVALVRERVAPFPL
jgi:hypothetical protein